MSSPVISVGFKNSLTSQHDWLPLPSVNSSSFLSQSSEGTHSLQDFNGLRYGDDNSSQAQIFINLSFSYHIRTSPSLEKSIKIPTILHYPTAKIASHPWCVCIKWLHGPTSPDTLRLLSPSASSSQKLILDSGKGIQMFFCLHQSFSKSDPTRKQRECTIIQQQQVHQNRQLLG